MNWSEAMTLWQAFDSMSARHVDEREWARLLATFPLFADVRKSRLRKLVRKATFAEFAAGETVVAQDDSDGSLHVVLEGSARAIGGSARRRMSIGDYFGELSFLGKRSPHHIVATELLYVMRLPGEAVGRLVLQQPALAVTLLRDLAGRLTPPVIAAPGCSESGT